MIPTLNSTNLRDFETWRLPPYQPPSAFSTMRWRALDRAAALCTEAIAAEGLVHLFGCGHSRMLCEEMTPRQGCFVGWHTIVELGLSFHNLIVGPNGLRQSLHLEKTLGYAEQILRNFAFGPKDVMIIVSTSGIREVIIEMAEGAKQRGLSVIALVSKAHCEQAKPAHPSGKKLMDVADVVLDNGAPIGDSLLTLAGSASDGVDPPLARPAN